MINRHRTLFKLVDGAIEAEGDSDQLHYSN